MKRSFLSNILRIFLFYALVAFLPLEYLMIIGAAIFSVTAMASTFGSLIWMSAIGVLVFGLFSGDFALGAFTALSFVIPGWIQGVLIRKRNSLSSIITFTTITRGVFLLICYNRMAALKNKSIGDMITGTASAELAENFSKGDYPEEMLNMLKDVIKLAQSMTPAIIAISALSFAFLSLCCVKFFLRKTPFVFAGIRKLSEIKADLSFTLGSVIIVALSFIVESDYKIVLFNASYVLWYIFSAIGFAFIYRVVKRGVKHRGLAFLSALLVSVFSLGMILPVMGIVSSFVKTDFDKKLEAAEDIVNETEENEDEERKDD